MNLFNFQETLKAMKHEELDEIAVSVFEDRRSLLLDLLQQRNAPPVPPASEKPNWCICSKCREMPTQKERKCCKRRTYLSMDQIFYEVCLNGTTLEVAVNSRCDIRVDIPSFDRKTLRHTAYRQFVMWRHGPLGAGNRVVIPSRCVWAIRMKYPSSDVRYTGYRDR